MSVIELIGFIITLLALFFLFGRQTMEERKKRRDPEGYAKEQERKAKLMREFLLGEEEKEESAIEKLRDEPHELEVWEEVKETPPPAPLIVAVPPPLKTHSEIQEMVGALQDKRSLVVFQTIFGPPKGL